MKVNRIAQIAGIFAEEGLGFLAGRGVIQAASGDSYRPDEKAPPSSDVDKARRLKRTFERLGPTFVKFGQMLASRVDLFSEEFIGELSSLHAEVAPFPDRVAIEIIESELGQSIGSVFSEFSQSPVASASVAQVYRAKLLSSGQEVAVKIQRPNLEKTLLEDLDLIVQMSSWLDKLVPSYRKSMMHVVAKEYTARSRTELDFVNEANAIQEFSDVYSSEKYFYFPKVFLDFCTDKVVVMEWIEGKRLGQIKGAEDLKKNGFVAKDFVQHFLRLQLSMSYEHGLIHADMHPGNIILKNDGRVGLIDFGLHAHIPKRTRDAVLNMLLYQAQGRIEDQVDAALELSPPGNEKDRARFRQELIDHYHKPRKRSGSAVSKDLIETVKISAKYQNKANPHLLMIVRNLLIIEGIFLKFDPSFDPFEKIGEYINKILMKRFSPQAIAGSFSPLLGEVAIALHRRPELLSKLMRLETKFAESRSLGDFLRSEDVISKPERSTHSGLYVSVGIAIGIAVAALLMPLLKEIAILMR